MLAEDSHEDGKKANIETVGAPRQFFGNMERRKTLSHSSLPSASAESSLRERATMLFLPVYVDCLAARVEAGQAFALADGRKGVATGTPAATKVLLALEIHESGGKDKIRQTTLPLFLSVEPEWVESVFPGQCAWEKAEEFDSKKGKVLHEDRLMFRGLILDRRERTVPKHSDAGELLAEQLVRGEIELPLDDEARQWIYRIQLAHRICPESGMPALETDDWNLIYHDVCEGKKSVKQLQEVSVSAALRDYLGPALVAFLEREAPAHVKLPGKRGGKDHLF